MQVRKFVNDVSLLLQIIVILVKKNDLNIYLNFLGNYCPCSLASGNSLRDGHFRAVWSHSWGTDRAV